MASKNEKAQGIHRIGGRLHIIDEIRSEAGELLSSVASPLRVEFKPEDIAQLFVGALMLGVPVALTEEVWNLGESLPPGRILLIAAVSLVVNAFFVKVLFYPKQKRPVRISIPVHNACYRGVCDSSTDSAAASRNHRNGTAS